MSHSTAQTQQSVRYAHVTVISTVLVALFVGYFFVDTEGFARQVDTSFAWSAKYFGGYWQLLLLANFAVALALSARPSAKARLGARESAEFPLFQWVTMILCTLLAGGGVFWAAAEPIAHFVSPPPIHGDIAPLSQSAIPLALSQSFLHWGFLAWSILGSVGAVVLMRLHYDQGLPLAPRTLLYPVLGRRAIHGWVGDTADIVSALSVFAGTVGPIGFLGVQISYGLHVLFGVPDTLFTQLVTIAGLMAVYLTSAVSGMHRGIQILSRLNIVLGALLLLFLVIAGPSTFIMSNLFSALGVHIRDFLPMALYRGEAGLFGDPGWLSYWTVFFWGWFIGYTPMMAIFIARVSRGRSARSIILMMSIVAPLLTMVWFAIVGGTGLGIEVNQPGAISEPFTGFNLPAALLAMTQGLPMGTLVSVLFLLLATLFVATTGDSMTYSLAVVSSGAEHPPLWLRVFWGLAMGITAMVLITGTGGGIGKLQSFIVVTAVPVSILLLPTLWGVFGVLDRGTEH